jgi:DNA-binding beta-propeller fold protein YncE
VNATTGVVTAIGGGSATITATVAGKTATQTVTVIGRPGTTVAAALPMGSRVRNVVTSGTTAYVALSTSGSVTAIDIPTSTIAWTLVLGGQVNDVAVNQANTRVVAASATGGAGKLYVINPATRLATDSIDLAAPPVRLVMNAAGTRVLVDENSFQLEIIDLTARSVIAMVPLPGTVTAMKLAAGDTTFFAGTSLGVIYEVSMSTGAIKRQFQPTSTVVDLDISPDGRTLVVADGSSSVSVVRLATGGLPNQTVDFSAGAIGGLAFTPDARQLWVSLGNTIYASPVEGTTFNVSLLTGRVTVAGSLLSRITFAKNGSAAFVIDESGNQVIVFK